LILFYFAHIYFRILIIFFFNSNAKWMLSGGVIAA
jgi:hypothetical protein